MEQEVVVKRCVTLPRGALPLQRHRGGPEMVKTVDWSRYERCPTCFRHDACVRMVYGHTAPQIRDGEGQLKYPHPGRRRKSAYAKGLPPRP
jgi:hypothetical protein